MIYTKNDILANIILSNHKILKVIDRFNIRLGLGNMTLKKVATFYGVNPDLLCLIINMYCDKNYIIQLPQDNKWIPDLLKYLERSHYYFLEDKVLRIKMQISKLIYEMVEPNASLLKNFIDNYMHEIKEHMGHENKIVFNYISILYLNSINVDTIPINSGFSIKEYEKDHDDIEQVLMDIKFLLLKHLPPNDTNDNRIKVLTYLFELEHELYNHQRIEDEILIPMAKRLEQESKALQLNLHE